MSTTPEKRAKQAAYARAWRAKNRDRDRALKRAWYQAHRDEIRAADHERYWSDPETHRARNRATRAANAEHYRQKDRERHARDREKRIEANRARRFGITVEKLREVLAPGRCAICGDTERLHVDHSHTSGRVRGLLCDGCNVGIGHFRERPDLLLRAIDYLASHGITPPSSGATTPIP